MLTNVDVDRWRQRIKLIIEIDGFVRAYFSLQAAYLLHYVSTRQNRTNLHIFSHASQRKRLLSHWTPLSSGVSPSVGSTSAFHRPTSIVVTRHLGCFAISHCGSSRCLTRILILCAISRSESDDDLLQGVGLSLSRRTSLDVLGAGQRLGLDYWLQLWLKLGSEWKMSLFWIRRAGI